MASFTTLWIYTILKPICGKEHYQEVSLPYGFTLFSNELYIGIKFGFRFTTLWIYTILKLSKSLDLTRYRFTTLWIYTILKLRVACFTGV